MCLLKLIHVPDLLHIPPTDSSACYYLHQKQSYPAGGDAVELGNVFIFSKSHTTRERAYYLLVHSIIFFVLSLMLGWIALPIFIVSIILALIVSYFLILMHISFK